LGRETLCSMYVAYFDIMIYLCIMFIRQTKKSNSRQGKVFFQYVLVQGYRINGKARQRNVLYLGSHNFMEDKEVRRKIGKALEEKIFNIIDFQNADSFYETLIEEHKKQVDKWYAKYLTKYKEQGRSSLSKPANPKTATFEEVDISSIETDNCREVGAEWLCLNMAGVLKIKNFLCAKGFVSKEIDLALISIISRAVFPASEHKTAQWLEQNSALWELFGTMESAPDRFALYRIAAKLSEHFDQFTDHVYGASMDLFSLKDRLMIFDLTNTYFEGRKLSSLLAQFGKSKEKRSDCKIISFSAVVNKWGFLSVSPVACSSWVK